jgi:hypothetical protein
MEPYALGDGYGHFAVSVSELDAEHRRLSDAGVEPGKIIDFNREGSLLARFFFVTDPDGYRIEVLLRISVNRDSHFNKSRTSISLSRGQRVRSNSACLVSVRDD